MGSVIKKKKWFRDVDSNHDTELQRLMSYRLDDPGTALKFEQTHRTLPNRSVRVASISAKLIRLSFIAERWPSGLRRTLGKRV